ncbi:MAG: nucleotide modification associated domain-containing protein [Candidatus Marsarchaeota archaeon]|nr:nucleotide modification associated domain-containing protein [Candidatus Marsarchaeota archaeon]
MKTWHETFRDYLFGGLDVPVEENISPESLISIMGKALGSTYIKTTNGMELNFRECERAFNLIKNLAIHLLVNMGMGRSSALELCYDIGLKKDADYGHSNIQKFGIVGIVVRLSDKVERINNIFGKNPKVKGERVQDNLIDIINYATYGEMLCDSAWD